LIAREMLSRIYRRTGYLPRNLTPRKMQRFTNYQILNACLAAGDTIKFWEKMPERIKLDRRQAMNLKLYLAWPTCISDYESGRGLLAGPSKLKPCLRRMLNQYLTKGWNKKEYKKFSAALIVSCM